MSTTIAAIGTALSNSGISIIRISGDNSLDIVSKIFSNFSNVRPNSIVYGSIKNEGKVLDNVLVSYFKAPKSYTGEDVCEINCHGGTEITKQILELVLENGAVLAKPGEFSKRAFLNGKMDLSQAEAVINLINAKTKSETRVFTKELNGDLSKKVKQMREKLIEILAHIEVSIDYPEYDYDEVKEDLLIELLQEEIDAITYLLNTYEQGKYIKDGINVAILGRPNVGKSSLLNNLAKSDKAIVTDIPGTTRDIVEERIILGNVFLNISDTAGIRDTDDIVEKIGVEKSIKLLDETDLVIYILNAQEEISKSDLELLSKIQNKGIKLIVAVNKMDKYQKSIFDTILDELEQIGIDDVIKVSILREEGIDSLKKKILDIFDTNDLDFEHELIITNVRHKELLRKSVESLRMAKNKITIGEPIDILSIYIKNAAKLLGEIIGAEVSQDVVDKIFEKFCVGK